jgi:hypothetical protein
MSKKLIAVASAAALALSALVAVPASANVAVEFTNGENDGSTKGLALQITVPYENELVAPTDDVEREFFTLVEATFTIPTKGDTLNVTTTGKVRVIDEETTKTNKYVASSGLTSWSYKALKNNDAVTFYVYTTSTTAETFTVSLGKNSTEFWIQGEAGPAYNIAVTAPKSIVTKDTPDEPNVLVVVTDVFGNELDDDNTDAPVGSVLPAGEELADINEFVYDDGKWGATLTAEEKGTYALSVVIDKPDAVTGLAKPVFSYFSTFTAGSLQEQLVALQEQVAALQATIAKRVTKKRFNKLARKWNAAFPTQKVKLKK